MDVVCKPRVCPGLSEERETVHYINFWAEAERGVVVQG
jgi:hypothetical protein